MLERSIIHLNVADFAVAVERVVDSRLRHRPLVIAAEGAARAVVYDMSEEAYQAGIRKGMALKRALRYCPDTAVLPPRTARYEKAMQQFLARVRPYSPLVEMTDCKGHLFVDATGTSRLFGPPPDVAWRIRKAIRSDMGFDPIWSVAPNKLVAKVASRMVKPTGEYIVAAGDEAGFLNPLPVYLIPGIEEQELKRCTEFNLARVHQMTTLSLEQMEIIFGRQGLLLHDALRGIDTSPVWSADRKPPVIRADHTFGNDTNDVKRMQAVLYRLVEQVGLELRQKRLAARRLRIMLDYSDGRRYFRQRTLRPATANDIGLFAKAQTTLDQLWQRRVRIRHLRLTCDRLTFPPAQLELFPSDATARRKTDNLIDALDRIRARYGRRAVQVGRSLAA